MSEEIAIPHRYEIYGQTIRDNILNLQFMGYNNSLPEAQRMCQILGECDRIQNGGTQKTFFFVRAVLKKGGGSNADK